MLFFTVSVTKPRNRGTSRRSLRASSSVHGRPQFGAVVLVLVLKFGRTDAFVGAGDRSEGGAHLPVAAGLRLL